VNLRTLALVLAVPVLAALGTGVPSASAQVASSVANNVPSAPAPERAATAELATRPWEWGPFFQGGSGVTDRWGYVFTAAGVRLGKVITGPHLPGVLRGQFEYAGEILPYWQAFTPPPHHELVTYTQNGLTYSYEAPYGGGTYTGVSITPIILRWNLDSARFFAPWLRRDGAPHFAPWIQGAGGLIYTTHKFPPDVLVPHGTPGGTSVWNFCPQFGVGFHYFVRPQRAITFSANAVHISSASLGDENPGVNASVQFQVGYTWWSRRP